MDVIPTIRTSPKRREIQPRTTTGVRLLTKVLRDLVTGQRFTDYADLKDAFRRRLLALGIRYQVHEFHDAFGLVGSNQRLVQCLPAPRRGVELLPSVSRFSRAEAVVVVARLSARLGIAVAPRAMSGGARARR